MKTSVYPFCLAPFFLGVPAFAAPAKAPTATLPNQQLLEAPDELRVGGQLRFVTAKGDDAGFSALTHTDVSAHISDGHQSAHWKREI